MDSATVASSTQVVAKRVCCVKNCKSRWKCVAIRLCFHRFPVPNETVIHRINEFGETEQIDRLEAWKIALGIDNVSPNSKVCSLHFTKKDYIVYLTTGCKKKCLKRTAVPSVSVPNDFFKLYRINHSKKLIPYVTQEIAEPTRHIEIKEEIEVKDEPLDEVPVEPQHQMLTDTDTKLPVIENTFSLTFQKKCSSTKLVDTNRAKTFQHTGVQVESISIVPTFMDFITNNSELHTITGIPAFHALDTIVESVIEETEGKYEKVSCQLKTTERVIMTCAKMKHDLSYSFLTIMFKNTYGKMTQSYCKDAFTDMIKILYRCCQKATADDVICSIFTQKCLNFHEYQNLLHRNENTSYFLIT